ncbi:hypothetical protein E1B28_001898 [Marasmius oreades]|uniref:Uncharacterized protein n=1 Tax=Marasmius oreades TaxID=181124 RepID=A0A9P7V4F2_9AGAR|nr:uncharacterized protein E1B28_001898 [Marasmius oreades]KAG7100118.1 hypothetical protein E1B28_001898 [Marasmius oreades]
MKRAREKQKVKETQINSNKRSQEELDHPEAHDAPKMHLALQQDPYKGYVCSEAPDVADDSGSDEKNGEGVKVYETAWELFRLMQDRFRCAIRGLGFTEMKAKYAVITLGTPY